MTDRQLPVPRTQSRSVSPRRKVLIATLLVAVGLIGITVTQAIGNPLGGGHGWWGGGMHGRWGGPLDPAQIEERADRLVRHLAIELDASNEQQERLRAIMRSMLRDVLPARGQAEAARRQARDILTQTTVDRGALERLRTDQIALADNVSRRIIQALVDAAEVLTPEQRRKLNDRLPPAGRGFGPPWRRG